MGDNRRRDHLVKPIPIVFHIGALQIHTYGIGLAITFWVSYRYFARRLRAHGYDDAWLGRAFVWIIAASVVGARAVHVVANWGFYSRNLGDIFAVWHGGLSSYGGLLGGVPTGLYLAHRWCKSLRLVVALDIVAPVLALAWAIGRLLGPQLMYQGGGYRTTAWYGMYYAGDAGKRVPVPIFQGIECFVVYLLALQVEKYVARRGGPFGVVITATVTLYGISRLFDESILLSHGPAGTALEITSDAFIVVGVFFVIFLLWRDRGHKAATRDDDSPPTDPWANPETLNSAAEQADTDGAGEAGDEVRPATARTAFDAGEQPVVVHGDGETANTGDRDPDGVHAGPEDLA
jgi:phosphatidylglycerol:prolipoprotein diacylglycerol transferase